MLGVYDAHTSDKHILLVNQWRCITWTCIIDDMESACPT